MLDLCSKQPSTIYSGLSHPRGPDSECRRANRVQHQVLCVQICPVCVLRSWLITRYRISRSASSQSAEECEECKQCEKCEECSIYAQNSLVLSILGYHIREQHQVSRFEGGELQQEPSRTPYEACSTLQKCKLLTSTYAVRRSIHSHHMITDFLIQRSAASRYKSKDIGQKQKPHWHPTFDDQSR
jgi:hypothetical protein